MSSAMEIAMKQMGELIAAAASPQSAIDALKAEMAKLTLSETPPEEPTTNSWWYEDLGEMTDIGGGGLVIGNGSMTGDDDIWFDEI